MLATFMSAALKSPIRDEMSSILISATLSLSFIYVVFVASSSGLESLVLCGTSESGHLE